MSCDNPTQPAAAPKVDAAEAPQASPPEVAATAGVDSRGPNESITLGEVAQPMEKAASASQQAPVTDPPEIAEAPVLASPKREITLKPVSPAGITEPVAKLEASKVEVQSRPVVTKQAEAPPADPTSVLHRANLLPSKPKEDTPKIDPPTAPPDSLATDSRASATSPGKHPASRKLPGLAASPNDLNPFYALPESKAPKITDQLEVPRETLKPAALPAQPSISLSPQQQPTNLPEKPKPVVVPGFQQQKPAAPLKVPKPVGTPPEPSVPVASQQQPATPAVPKPVKVPQKHIVHVALQQPAASSGDRKSSDTPPKPMVQQAQPEAPNNADIQLPQPAATTASQQPTAPPKVSKPAVPAALQQQPTELPKASKPKPRAPLATQQQPDVPPEAPKPVDAPPMSVVPVASQKPQPNALSIVSKSVDVPPKSRVPVAPQKPMPRIVHQRTETSATEGVNPAPTTATTVLQPANPTPTPLATKPNDQPRKLSSQSPGSMNCLPTLGQWPNVSSKLTQKPVATATGPSAQTTRPEVAATSKSTPAKANVDEDDVVEIVDGPVQKKRKLPSETLTASQAKLAALEKIKQQAIVTRPVKRLQTTTTTTTTTETPLTQQLQHRLEPPMADRKAAARAYALGNSAPPKASSFATQLASIHEAIRANRLAIRGNNEAIKANWAYLKTNCNDQDLAGRRVAFESNWEAINVNGYCIQANGSCIKAHWEAIHAHEDEIEANLNAIKANWEGIRENWDAIQDNGVGINSIHVRLENRGKTGTTTCAPGTTAATTS